jgi:hypothetical protein
VTLLLAYELEDLWLAIMDRLEESLLPAITLANRTGELDALLRLLGMSDLLGDAGNLDRRRGRILVMGDKAN